jgi:hypothetical protein
VDRITPRTSADPRFASRELPEKSVADFVQNTVGTASLQYRARVHLHASADCAKARMPIPIDAEVIYDNTCIVDVGSDAPHQPALWLGVLDADFDALDAPELASAIIELGDRYRAAERFR